MSDHVNITLTMQFAIRTKLATYWLYPFQKRFRVAHNLLASEVNAWWSYDNIGVARIFAAGMNC